MGRPRICLYEVLDVSRDATDAEIKKAYRTAALVNHPDKNPGREEEASEKFKLVQHAYSVLSDAHERAWYDSHRTQILRGHDPDNAQDTQADPSAATDVDLFSCFSSAAFDGFHDGPEGFYTFYQGIFDALWEEEVDVMTNDKDRKNIPSAAPFGNSKSNWETVRDFYRLWDAFSSYKTFSFADKWNLADGPNRDYRRHMEKENKKERSRVKKEFNSTVRELAAFVKKRDPRVASRKTQEENERAEKQKEASAKEKIRLQQRKDNAAHTRAARDEALEEDAAGLDEILASIAKDERIERNRRKKGRRRRQKAFNFEEDVNNSAETEDISSGEDGNFETNGKSLSGSSEEDEDGDLSSESEEDLYCIACRKAFRTIAQKTDHERSKKHRGAVAKLKKEVLRTEEEFRTAKPGQSKDTESQIEYLTRDVEKLDIEVDKEGINVDEMAEGFGMQTKSKKKQKKRAKKLASFQTGTRNGEAEDIDPEETLNNPESSIANTASAAGSDKDLKEVNGEEENESRSLSKKQKRRLREQKKKERKEEEESVQVDGNALSCNVCKTVFQTRNKLMQHVNSTGHALHMEPKSTSSQRRRG